jgi:hypothetical protein
MTERACTICGIVRPMTEFSKGNARGGYKSYCKVCQREAHKDYATRNKTRERTVPTEKCCPTCKRTLPGSAFYVNKRTKDGLQAYCKECQDKTNRQWYETNRDHKLRQKAGWYQANWERQRRLSTEWKRTHRFEDREHVMRRLARLRRTTIAKVSYPAIWERDGGICYLCGQPIDRSDVHFDHVIPLSKGGTHTEDNIRATHSRCNLSKSDKTLAEFT